MWFDLGNSPREFTREKVAGRTIVSTTTNGTRALRACAGARNVLAAAFVNLESTARWLESARPERLVVVCAGTFDETALEDVLGAGALVGDQLQGQENTNYRQQQQIQSNQTELNRNRQEIERLQRQQSEY